MSARVGCVVGILAGAFGRQDFVDVDEGRESWMSSSLTATSMAVIWVWMRHRSGMAAVLGPFEALLLTGEAVDRSAGVTCWLQRGAAARQPRL